MPRLSLAVAPLPSDDAIYYAQVAHDWWVILIRDGIRNGELIRAYIAKLRNTPVWATLTAVFGTDPLAEPGRTAALYPDHERAPLDVIPPMEAAGILRAWPQGVLL